MSMGARLMLALASRMEVVYGKSFNHSQKAYLNCPGEVFLDDGTFKGMDSKGREQSFPEAASSSQAFKAYRITGDEGQETCPQDFGPRAILKLGFIIPKNESNHRSTEMEEVVDYSSMSINVTSGALLKLIRSRAKNHL